MIFVCTSFVGREPGNTAAIVQARSPLFAAVALERKLSRLGMGQEISPDDMVPLDRREVIILNDGDFQIINKGDTIMD